MTKIGTNENKIKMAERRIQKMNLYMVEENNKNKGNSKNAT